MSKKNYKLMVHDRYTEVHTNQLDLESAEEMLERHRRTFPDLHYWIEEDDYEPKEERYYNDNACDGWEDIYPI